MRIAYLLAYLSRLFVLIPFPGLSSAYKQNLKVPQEMIISLSSLVKHLRQTETVKLILLSVGY
jgi:hypothetical protein